MAAVDELHGKVTKAETRPFGEVKKGYTWFAEGDVLFAKITPCMQNGKHAVARNLIDGIGFGTTEFHVLRPGTRVASDWVHFFLRQPAILADAAAHFSGSVGQQRLPESYLKNILIPLPPISEQVRIATMLTEQMALHEQVRTMITERAKLAVAIEPSYLRGLFPVGLGNDMHAPESWRFVPLGEVADVVSGVTLGRKLRETPTRRVPYLRVANVKDGYLDLSEVKRIDVTTAEFDKWRLKTGDILLTEGGDPDKLGRGTFWKEQIPGCIHQNHIFRVRFAPEVAYPPFVAAQLGSPYGKAYFFRHAKQTTGIASINQKVLRGFPLFLPPIEEQRRVFENLDGKLSAAAAIKEQFRRESEALERLPATFLRQAFSGAL